MVLKATPEPKKPHLCLISHGCRKNDGQSRVNYEILKAALAKGWQVTFIGSYLSDDLREAPALTWRKVERSRLPSNLIKNLLFSVWASILLLRHRRQFDIVHANGFIVWPASHINTAHFVHSGWLKSRFYPYRPVKSLYALYQTSFTLLNSYLERYAFSVSRRLIAVSEGVRQEIRSTGVGQDKIFVIHNGVDLAEFHPGQAQRRKFSLPEDATLFLFAGDIRSKRKNLESVIMALSQVPEIHLAVAGALKGSPYPELAARLGVADRVHFLGLMTEMPDLMRSADVFVFPSRYEPFGLVLLEALASGLPVITAASAGGAEVVGEGGVVISDPDDIQQLARAMTQLAKDSQMRARVAHAARQVADGLSWSRMTERYFEHYHQLAPPIGRSDDAEPLVRRIVAAASQGTGSGDEDRLRDLLGQFDAAFLAFDRRQKKQGFLHCFRRLRAGGFDLFVFEGTGFAIGIAAILARLLYHRRYVFSSGDAVAPFLTARLPIARPFFALYETLLYRCCSGFIGWTPYLAGRALSFGAPRAVTAPGWAPYPSNPQAMQSARAEIRERLGIPQHAIVFGLAGSLVWSARRQYCYGSELLRAAARAKSAPTILIVGDGSGLAHLKALAGTALGKTIFLPGRVERSEVPKYLAAMDVGSLPQSVDQVGSFRYTTKLAEYRDAGLCFVTTEIPMAYDLDNGDIWRLPGPSPWANQFLDALAEFMDSVSLAQLQARQESQTPSDAFDKHRQVRRVTAFIEDILKNNRTPPRKSDAAR